MVFAVISLPSSGHKLCVCTMISMKIAARPRRDSRMSESSALKRSDSSSVLGIRASLL